MFSFPAKKIFWVLWPIFTSKTTIKTLVKSPSEPVVSDPWKLMKIDGIGRNSVTYHENRFQTCPTYYFTQLSLWFPGDLVRISSTKHENVVFLSWEASTTLRCQKITRKSRRVGQQVKNIFFCRKWKYNPWSTSGAILYFFRALEAL